VSIGREFLVAIGFVYSSSLEELDVIRQAVPLSARLLRRQTAETMHAHEHRFSLPQRGDTPPTGRVVQDKPPPKLLDGLLAKVRGGPCGGYFFR
jgi:hypothetical protein